MYLAEPIFISLQGEGTNIGKPSIFIRFFGCNFCCKWCDSLYAVNNPENLINISVSEICEQIKKIKEKYNCNNIVFTGGEPTLFYKEINEIQNILGDGYTYEIETNGSNIIKCKINQINISPKLSNSGNRLYELQALNELNNYGNENSNICFKFVAQGKADFEEILNYINNYKLNKENIWIMPEGVDQNSQNNKEVLEFCMVNGFRYCIRMHILIFGNKKGV